MRFYYCDAKIILKMWMNSQGSEWCSVVWTHSIWFYLSSFSFWVGFDSVYRTQINTRHWIQMLIWNKFRRQDKTPRHRTLFELENSFSTATATSIIHFTIIPFYAIDIFALCTSNHIKRWTTPNHNNNHREIMVTFVDSVVSFLFQHFIWESELLYLFSDPVRQSIFRNLT